MENPPAVAKTPAPQKTELRRVSDTMAGNAVILSAKAQNTINVMKDISTHFYSVGKYKTTDANGMDVWKDKMEPDSFAIRTLSTVQRINMETVSVEWENQNDLMNAAVRIRVRGWKGKKDNPIVEDSVELRYSMRAIAMKYVMDKMSPKTKWEKLPGAQKKTKVEKPAEWQEADVDVLDSGWMMPKAFKNQVALRSYLTDQYTFLDRTAETKAKRRLGLALLGFDWRDPEEITNESGEIATVKKGMKSLEVPQEAIDLATRIAKCKTREEYDALSAEVDDIASKNEKHVHDFLTAKCTEKLAELESMTVEESQEASESEEEDGKKEDPQATEAKEEKPAEEQETQPQDVPVVTKPEMNKLVMHINSSMNAEKMKGIVESRKADPFSKEQWQTIRVAVRNRLTQINEKAKSEGKQFDGRPITQQIEEVIG